MLRAIPFLALCTSACATVNSYSPSSSCRADPPAAATPFTDANLSRLVGRFRMTFVTTAFAASPRGTIVHLAQADSATRARAKGRGPGGGIGPLPRRDLRLVGRAYWRRDRPPEAAEWDDGTLYLGCRGCADGSPDSLHVEAVSAEGFWGRWVNPQTGTVVVTGRDGKRRPNPAGYFCAERIGRSQRRIAALERQ